MEETVVFEFEFLRRIFQTSHAASSSGSVKEFVAIILKDSNFPTDLPPHPVFEPRYNRLPPFAGCSRRWQIQNSFNHSLDSVAPLNSSFPQGELIEFRQGVVNKSYNGTEKKGPPLLDLRPVIEWVENSPVPGYSEKWP